MAAASATSVNKDMATSMERLATGKRINSAADDAAGTAIASRLSSEIRGTNQAIRNAMDGQALINTAEGAHKEIENILQRMRELAVQASNDTNDADDRINLQAEFMQLSGEIDRIAATTTWAGQSLLNGDGDDGETATNAGSTAEFKLQIGGRANTTDSLNVAIRAVNSDSLGVQSHNSILFEDQEVDVTEAEGDARDSQLGVKFDNNSGTIQITTKAAIGDDDDGEYGTGTISFTFEGETIDFDFDDSDDAKAIADGILEAFETEFDSGWTVTVTGTGDNATVTIVRDDTLSLLTQGGATGAISTIDDAIKLINTQRAELGAISNRLDNTVNNLTNIVINLEGGKGRIEDADFAAESTNLAKNQILQQASTAMLAQANASKQNVLSLLQG